MKTKLISFAIQSNQGYLDSQGYISSMLEKQALRGAANKCLLTGTLGWISGMGPHGSKAKQTKADEKNMDNTKFRENKCLHFENDSIYFILVDLIMNFISH